MPRLPRYPRPGDSNRELAATIRNLIDYCRSITPQSSPSVRVSAFANGTTFRADKTRRETSGARLAGTEYASYFKVYDASAGGACKIGVKDGSAVDPLVCQCGFVWANGEVVGVDAYESDAIESAGSIWVWLVTQIGPTGASASIMTTSDSTAPYGYGYATQSQLLGRVTIASSGSDVVVAAINQDYLKGGEHMAVFFSDCALLEDE